MARIRVKYGRLFVGGKKEGTKQKPLHKIPRQKFHKRAHAYKANGHRPREVDKWTPFNPHEPAPFWAPENEGASMSNGQHEPETITTEAPDTTPHDATALFCPTCFAGSGKPKGHRGRHMAQPQKEKLSSTERSEAARKAAITRKANRENGHVPTPRPAPEPPEPVMAITVTNTRGFELIERENAMLRAEVTDLRARLTKLEETAQNAVSMLSLAAPAKKTLMEKL